MDMRDSQLDDIFMALADPTRRAILARLTLGAANVAELCEPFDMSQPAISRHLKMLERAGLVSREQSGTARYCHLEAQALEDAFLWVEGYREFWEERYERLDEVLQRQVAKKPTTKGRKRK